MEVECDLCLQKSEVPAGKWSTQCKNSLCPGRLLLAPLRENMKYVRTNCNNNAIFFRVSSSSSSFTCECCDRSFVCGDLIIEIRCKHFVYKATLKVSLEDEIKRLKEELTIEREQKSEVSKRALEADDLQKDNKKLRNEMEKLDAEIRENKLKMSHMEEIIRRQERELEAKNDEVQTMRTIAMNLTSSRTLSAAGSDEATPEKCEPPVPKKPRKMKR